MTQAPNPTPTENPQPSATPERNTARTQAEVRASSKRTSTNDLARAIEERLRARRGGEQVANTQVEDPAETPEEAQPQSETPTPEPEMEAREGADGGPDDDAADSEDAIERLDDLLEALELDSETFGNLKTTLKVDGEEVEVTLGDVLKNHQFAARNTQKAQELAEQRRAFDQEKAQQIQALKQSIDESKAAHQAAWNVLQAELQDPQVQQLEQTDPAAYLQVVRYAQQRQQQLQQSFANLLAQEKAHAERLFEERRQVGHQRLMELIPDFDTIERRSKIAKVFSERGVRPEELDNLLDERIIHFASEFADLREKLAAYEKREEEAKKLAKKAVKDHPQTAKGGARQQGQQRSASKKRLEAAKQKIRDSKGRNRLLASQAAFEEILRRK